MARRTELISVTCYDNDGGLDWSWNGSQWLEWYAWQRGLGRLPEIIAQDLRDHFERGLSAAIASGDLFKNTCSADELKKLISGLNKG